MLDNKNFVYKQIEERDVHFIRFWFSDILGNLKAFAVTDSEIMDAFEEGMGFDGSAIEGFTRTVESDMVAFPDAQTFQILPWRPKDNGVARMFCEIKMPDGTPFEGDPRYVLKQMTQKAKRMGYTLNVGPELEFFYFKDDTAPCPLDHAGYFDLTSIDHASDLRRDTVLTLEKMSIPVEYSHHEVSPSQQEVDLRFADALSMADAVITYKMVVKEVALQHGVYASFMPKPCADWNGSSMHVHQSLFDDDDRNVFYDPNDPDGFNLSKIAKYYIAGLLKYAPEYTLITNQYANSYKRLIPGTEAPNYICWGHNNRSALVRVPLYKPGKETATRIELRSPDPAANPYLAFAVMLGAGLKGIEEELPLMAPCDGIDVFAMTDAEREKAGYKPLPASLHTAVNSFESSALMKEILGEHIHEQIVLNKRTEVAAYNKQISQWELDEYLSVL